MEQRSITLPPQVLIPEIIRTVRTGPFILRVTGSSMAPTLKNGRSLVELVAPTVPPVRGQILLFCRENGQCVLHRCIGVADDGTVTVNGDAQDWTEQIRPEQIIARVSRICRTDCWQDCDSAACRAYAALWPLTRRLRPTLIALRSRGKAQ